MGARIGGGRALPDALPLPLRRLLAVESDRFDAPGEKTAVIRSFDY
ncbi:hypothetical protein ACPEIC_40970 [Stenotrophomonas sp. NPDC087984]